MDEIRSWWRVPAIAHFCSLFRSAFGLTDFEIEDLEDALMISGGEENSRFLADLHARLLRGLFSKKADITADNFELYLSEVLKIRWVEDLKRENPLESTEYRKLPTCEKVKILHGLCDWRLDVDDVAELLKGMEADSLRVEPLGRDSENNTYWYFYGTRLYKEYIERMDNGNKAKDGKQRTKRKKKKKMKKKRNVKKKRSDYEFESPTSSESERSSDLDYLAEDEEDENEDDMTEHHGDAHVKKTWSLVCSTQEDWETLAETLSKSKNKEEKLLHQTLTVDFLAEIARMLEVKDKSFRKKMLVEMAPRRSSDRIAIKAQQQEEEDKQAEMERQQEKERMVEIKKQEAEEREKERQILAEKRQQERAERARLREERQWLVANGGDLSEELLLSLERNGDEDEDEAEDKKLDELDKAFEGDVDMFTGMYKVLDAVKSHEDGWLFLEPVDESYAPHYSEIITNPMDLSSIEKKIEDKVYKGLKEFISDFKLMFSNCLDYNGPDSCYTQMANTLENVFNRHMKKHFPDDDNPSSDEDFEEELTETELRKLNKKKHEGKEASVGGNGMDDNFALAADMHRTNMQNAALRFPDPNMYARHYGMMANGPHMAAMQAFPQQMPYVGQPFYPPHMYPQGHHPHPAAAYTRFNMNDLTGAVPPMFRPPMMGMPPRHAGMAPPGSIAGQEMHAAAATRGVAPIATKGESSPSLWTNSPMQDMRGIGHAYARHPLATLNNPWQAAAGLAHDPRQLMGAWRPGHLAVPNDVGKFEQAKGTSVDAGAGQEGASRDIASEQPPDVADQRDHKEENTDHRAMPPKKLSGNQPTEDDLRFPFITVHQQQEPDINHKDGDPTSLLRPANYGVPNKGPALPAESTSNGNPNEVDSSTHRDNTANSNYDGDEKVYMNLDSVRSGEKRANPYSVSSIMGEEEKRPEEARLKFSTLLQEMSQGRKFEATPMHGSPAQKPSPAGMNVRHFMDLNMTRGHLPPSSIMRDTPKMEQPSSPSQFQSPMFSAYPKQAPNSRLPLDPTAVVSSAPQAASVRSPAGHMFNQDNNRSFVPRQLYSPYGAASHGELQRQRMFLLQQQQQQLQQQLYGYQQHQQLQQRQPQQQQLQQRQPQQQQQQLQQQQQRQPQQIQQQLPQQTQQHQDEKQQEQRKQVQQHPQQPQQQHQQQEPQQMKYHDMKTVASTARIHGTLSKDFMYMGQRPVQDTVLEQYQNGETRSSLDELTTKNSRIS